jgi:hypothetical protein
MCYKFLAVNAVSMYAGCICINRRLREDIIMQKLPYDYIRRAYSVKPQPGSRVRHTETGRAGTIMRTPNSGAHHVSVKFDGDRFALPCHPLALDYAPAEERAA